MASETSQTLDRGLRVLKVLAESPDGLTITELSGRLQVNRTVVYRLISTLEQHALVRRDARSRLFVGLGVLHLASAVQPLLRDLAMPVLRSLAESLGSTAHLTVADGDEALALAVVEPTASGPATRCRRGRPARPSRSSTSRSRRTPSRAASCRAAPAAWPPRCAGSRGCAPAWAW